MSAPLSRSAPRATASTWSEDDVRGALAQAARASADEVLVAERRAAVAMVLRLSDAPEVLLMRRAERAGDPWSGQVSCPGGRHEPSDPDLLHTARRETHEELGVDLGRDARALGQLAPIQAMGRGKIIPMTVTPFVFVATAPIRPSPSAEATHAFWLPLAAAARGELDDTFVYAHLDPPLTLPCWRYQGEQVWGLTYKMVYTLLESLGAVGPMVWPTPAR